MSASSEVKKLTVDPGVHYLAGIVDQLQARLDACCPPTGSAAPPRESELAARESVQTEGGKAAGSKKKT